MMDGITPTRRDPSLEEIAACFPPNREDQSRGSEPPVSGNDPLISAGELPVSGSDPLPSEEASAAYFSCLKPQSFSNRAPVLPKPELTDNMVYSEATLTYLIGVMGIGSMKLSADASLKVSEIAQKARETKVNDQLKQIEEAYAKRASAAKAGKTASIIGWTITGLSLIAGAALVCTGVGGALGAGLLVGAFCGIAMNLAGDKLAGVLVSGLKALGLSETAAQVVAQIALTVGVMLISCGVGAIAGRISNRIASGATKLAQAAANNQANVAQAATRLSRLAQFAETRAATATAVIQGAASVPQAALQIKAASSSLDAAHHSAEATRTRADADVLQSAVDMAVQHLGDCLNSINETMRISLYTIQTAQQPRRLSA